jgi:hypothetical protein
MSEDEQFEEAEPLPAGAVEAVLGWYEAIESGDFDRIWAHLDDNMRLCEAQLWVFANLEHPTLAGIDRDVLAADLAAEKSSHHLRPFFEDSRASAAPANLPSWPREFLGVPSHRRLVGEDLDVVLVVDTRTVPAIVPGTTLLDPQESRIVLTRFTERGWLIAGNDYNPPIPGWPPSNGAPIERIPPVSG